MRELADRTREHRGDAHVHRVAALVVHAHAGFGSPLATRRHRAMHAAHGLLQGTLGLAPGLRHAQSRQRKNDPHSASLHEYLWIRSSWLHYTRHRPYNGLRVEQNPQEVPNT